MLVTIPVGTGVSVFSLHPGMIHTNLGRHLESNRLVLRFVLPIASHLFLKNHVQGAQTTIHCAVADVEEDSGKYFRY